MMYIVRQVHKDGLQWTVIQVPEAQARAMRRRGEPYVFHTSAEAYTVCHKLKRRHKEKRQMSLLPDDVSEPTREQPPIKLRAEPARIFCLPETMVPKGPPEATRVIRDLLDRK